MSTKCSNHRASSVGLLCLCLLLHCKALDLWGLACYWIYDHLFPFSACLSLCPCRVEHFNRMSLILLCRAFQYDVSALAVQSMLIWCHRYCCGELFSVMSLLFLFRAFSMMPLLSPCRACQYDVIALTVQSLSVWCHCSACFVSVVCTSGAMSIKLLPSLFSWSFCFLS